MVIKPDRGEKSRTPLSKERVLLAALALADESGIESISMRKLAQMLGVKAMSLYNHVANKDEILDGIADMITSEIEIPDIKTDWKVAMRQKAISVREVLLRHPWVLSTYRVNYGSTRMRYYDSVIGILREAGFSIKMAYQAFMAMDSYVYGFALHEVISPFKVEERPDIAATMQPRITAEDYPYIAESMGYLLGSNSQEDSTSRSFESEFEFGLNLLLDGLERFKNR